MEQEEIQAARQAVMDETGDMPPCPFCQRARVQRSDYVRCCRCGVNWLDGENLSKNPKIERYNKMVEAGRAQSKPAGPKGTES